MELIGLALGLKVGGEGIRNRGLPWLQGLSAGWMGMAFTDMEGGEESVWGSKGQVWTTLSVSQSPIKGAELRASLALWTQVRDGFKRLGVEIFETVALDRQGMQTKKSQERLGPRQLLKIEQRRKKEQ